jgi:hypothetical protein
VKRYQGLILETIKGKRKEGILMKRIFFVLLLALGIILQGASLWADDDAIMDVDNHDAAFTGTWGTSTTKILYYGDNYRYAWGSGSSTTTREAVFTTNQYADVSGYYAMYVRWTTATNREESVLYRIYDGVADTSYGSDYCYVNQTQNGGEWRYCDTVYLTAGHRGVVKVGKVRFVRVTKDGGDIANNSLRDYHIGDEPGLDWSGATERNIATQVTSNCSYLTNLATVTITAPTSGYVFVHANGIAELSTTDRWVRVGIDDVSGGGSFDSYAPFLENCSAEVNAGSYEDERRYTVSNVYYVSSGSNTFYLKACKESGATGRIMWDDFVAIFFPTRY